MQAIVALQYINVLRNCANVVYSCLQPRLGFCTASKLISYITKHANGTAMWHLGWNAYSNEELTYLMNNKMYSICVHIISSFYLVSESTVIAEMIITSYFKA